ncbi:1,5-anhydro-D-fructose reductase [Bactrocera dorsalis]|uniref:1,5-anhydro-D-fructose reductase n=1 Tax=Bactrocera dorsalis TaxID=27457 RepID=A0ABM3K0T6_BACDO|nr:1,5-anhydro-D-fructose reductase [Bactrocera dorsalis]
MYAPCAKVCLLDDRDAKTKLARTVKFYNGVKVPIVGLGTADLEAHITARCVKDAIDAGIRHIDCAPIFCNQEEVGQAIKEKIDEGLIKRENLYISSKLWDSRHGPKWVRRSLEETLKQLQLDYLDNYVMHTPMGFKDGFENYPRNNRGEILFSDIDYVDTWHAMETLVDDGLVRSIGLANFNAEQIERILDVARIPPANLQVECHPYLTQKKLMDLCCKHNIVFMVSNPTGPKKKNANIIPLKNNPKILCLAKKYGKSAVEILIRYQVQRGNVVMAKTTQKDHMIQNVMIESFKLCRKDVEILDLMNCNFRSKTLAYASGHPYHPFENDCI